LSIPTFDQCEKVYTSSSLSGDQWRLLRILSGLIATLTVVAALIHIVVLIAVCFVALLSLATLSRVSPRSRIGIHANGLLLRRWPWQRVLIGWDRMTALRVEDGLLEHVVSGSGVRAATRRITVLTIRTWRADGGVGYVRIGPDIPADGALCAGPFGEHVRDTIIPWASGEAVRRNGTRDPKPRADLEHVRAAIVACAGLTGPGPTSTRIATLPYRALDRVFPTITWSMQGWDRPQLPVTAPAPPPGRRALSPVGPTAPARALPYPGAAPAATVTTAPASVAGAVQVGPNDDEYIGRACPYCRLPISAGQMIVVCPECRVPHHADCWRENGSCTTYGCVGGPST